MWARSEGLKKLRRDWHEFRIRARREAFSTDEFANSEITEYDLDTAGITGQDNPKSYQYDRPLNGENGTPDNGTDVREFANR